MSRRSRPSSTASTQYGFVTDVETDTLPPGLSEDGHPADLGEEG